jgi:hypothetical protein
MTVRVSARADALTTRARLVARVEELQDRLDRHPDAETRAELENVSALINAIDRRRKPEFSPTKFPGGR